MNANEQKKTAVRNLIVLMTLALMLCVWPLCLVRRTTMLSSNISMPYLSTEQYLRADAPLAQTFTAQTSRLEAIEFAVDYDGALPEDGAFVFELCDSKGNVITNREVGFAEIDSFHFYPVSINQWINKGEEYTFSISVAEDYDNLLRGVYTVATEPCAAGNQSLYLGEEKLDGYALTRYSYGFPFNIKNIGCIWAFLITCSILLSRLFGLNIVKTKGKESGFGKRVTTLVDNIWNLVNKHQVLVLLLEMFGILFIVAYICRVRIVDWDEAYSLRMVTKYSFTEMIKVTAEDIHPPLYYALLRLFSMVFGTSIFSLKMLSVVFEGCVMLLGITKIRKHWGFETAFLFNLVVGLGPQFISYSINIRMYSLSLLFVMLCAILAYEIIQGQGKWNWFFFVLAALGGVYTHYFNVVPLAIIYGYLLIGLLLEDKKKCKYFWLSCVVTVVGYLPWLRVVIESLGRSGTKTEGVSVEGFDFDNLLNWAFSTNIEFSVFMPIILFVICVALLVREHKRYSKQEILFLVMCAINIVLSYVGCRLVTSATARFWDNRYVFAALGLFWLFLLIVSCNRGKALFCSMTLWIAVMVASAFVIQMTKEVGANAYVEDAYKVLEQVRDEDMLLYNYDTYDVLYGAHLREQEFVFIDDVNWESLEQDYVYMIGWGGHWFDSQVQEKYNLQVESCGTMRFEEGVAGVELYKITYSLQ